MDSDVPTSAAAQPILVLRRAAFAMGLAAALAYSQLADFPGQIAFVVVPFILAIALHVVPLLWPRAPDPFSPAGYNGIYGMVGLLASLLTVIEAGKIELRYLPELSSRVKGDLASTVVWSYCLAQACYLIGYYWPVPPTQKRSRFTGIEWSTGRVFIASALCLAIAIPVYAWFQARLGTDLTDITQLGKGKAVWREDPTQTWIIRGILLAYIPAMLGLALALERRSVSGTVLALVLAAVEGGLVLRAGQRGLTLIFFITCAAMFHYMRRRLPLALLLVVGAVALVASNTLVQYRIKDPEQVTMAPLQERLNASQQLQDHEYDRQRLSTLAVVFYYFPEKQDYLLGQSWFGLVALPIPRWLWAGKAETFVWRDTNIVPELVGAPVPTPYHGVLYANFSWIGVVIGMIGWGLVQRRLYEWAMAARGDKSVTLIYCNALFITSPTLLALLPLTQFVLPILAIILFVGYRPSSLPAALPQGAQS